MGTIRITAIDHVVDTVIWPRLAKVLDRYPDIRVEINTEYRMVDIAAERFDIGVRYGDQLHQDMIAVRLTDEVPMKIVGSAQYLAAHGVPTSVDDLLRHNCITLRLASRGGLYAWELRHEGREVEARVQGQLTFSGVYQMLGAALTGHGLVMLPQELTQPHVDAGRLREVMDDWCPSFPPLHAYYPSRRNSSRAMGIVIDAIRKPQ